MDSAINKSEFSVFLLGNGFDLAHGLETSYSDFINSLESISKSDKIKFARVFNPIPYNHKREDREFKSSVLRRVKNNHERSLWSDIELTYYLILKEKIQEAKSSDSTTLFERIERYNNDFEQVKDLLKEYLKDQVHGIEKGIPQFNRMISQTNMNDGLIINLNYTDYIRVLYPKCSLAKYHIHGQLNVDKNPIVFGFSPSSEQLIELFDENENELLKNIKQTYYKRGALYHAMARINSRSLAQNSKYNLHLIGASCGLSDRTILEELITNEHLKKIYIHYYEDFEDGQVMSISRL